MAIYGLEVPFGLLEPHSVLLVLFRVCLLFALPLVGRRAIIALLLQLLVSALDNMPLHHHCRLLDGGACHLEDLGPHPPWQQQLRR
jgi:hypothetical protein